MIRRFVAVPGEDERPAQNDKQADRDEEHDG